MIIGTCRPVGQRIERKSPTSVVVCCPSFYGKLLDLDGPCSFHACNTGSSLNLFRQSVSQVLLSRLPCHLLHTQNTDLLFARSRDPLKVTSPTFRSVSFRCVGAERTPSTVSDQIQYATALKALTTSAHFKTHLQWHRQISQ